MAQVKVNGIHINYELSGPQDGPVVVLSHSLGSSLIMWEPQVKPLETRFRVLRYDTRGHGQSDAPAGAYTLEQLMEDAVGLLDRLGIDIVHWVGLSMGGMIGLCLALNHPGRLRTLALCDTTAIIPEDAQPMWQADSQLVVLPNAAHFSNVEQADAFNDALVRFLSQG